MSDARYRKFDIVLVWKFDRFARSLKMLVDSLALFQDLGIDFISYKENIDTTTSMGGSSSILIVPMRNLNASLSGIGSRQASRQNGRNITTNGAEKSWL